MKLLNSILILGSFIYFLNAQSPFSLEEENTFEGGLGITWIDGQSFTTFTLSPDISFGNVGVGLNIELLFNNSGGFEFRKTGWDKGAGILRAIRYIRYGYKYDPVYARIGTLDAATLGHGFLLWYYSNGSNYDQRKIGLAFDLDFDKFGFETVTSNLLNVEIYGGRLYYRPLFSSEIPVIKNLELGATLISDRDPDNINDTDDAVTAWGLDIGLPVIQQKFFTTTIYYDFAKISEFGSGNVVGVDFGFPDLIGILSLSTKLEKRFLGDKFLPNYFGPLYELERKVYVPETGLDKRSALTTTGSSEGIFGQLAGNFAGKIKLIGSFQKLNGIGHSGIMHLEARMPELIPSMIFRATYDKTNIDSFDDVTTLDVFSLASVEIGYKTYNFLILSMLYRWYFIEVEPNIFKPQERIEPRISVSFAF